MHKSILKTLRFKHTGWLPYVILIYSGFLFFPLVLGDPTREAVWRTVISYAVFLPIYFHGFERPGARLFWHVAAMAALGAWLAPVNYGASTYFVYACAFAAFITPPRRAALVAAGVLSVLVIASQLQGLPIRFIWASALLSVMVGLVNFFWASLSKKDAELKQSREEVRMLAATAERERIARDLHDLLGHTLSLVTVKAELAARLLESGQTRRAAKEIRDLESVSRDGLTQVRQAVAGYRATDLAAELNHCRAALDAAGIQVASELADDGGLSTEQRTVLGLILREALTNVLRHSQASRCEVQFTRHDGGVRLRVQDNGRGGPVEMGSGLRGISERALALGGALRLDDSKGLRLEVDMPEVA